jgi:hypothetical protein
MCVSCQSNRIFAVELAFYGTRGATLPEAVWMRNLGANGLRIEDEQEQAKAPNTQATHRSIVSPVHHDTPFDHAIFRNVPQMERDWSYTILRKLSADEAGGSFSYLCLEI